MHKMRRTCGRLLLGDEALEQPRLQGDPEGADKKSLCGYGRSPEEVGGFFLIYIAPYKSI
jgi:hypothetical protein